MGHTPEKDSTIKELAKMIAEEHLKLNLIGKFQRLFYLEDTLNY